MHLYIEVCCDRHCHVIYTCRSFLRAFFCFFDFSAVATFDSINAHSLLAGTRWRGSGLAKACTQWVCVCVVYLLRKYVQCLTSIALPFAFKLSLGNSILQYQQWLTHWNSCYLPLWAHIWVCARRSFFAIVWPTNERASERQTLLSLKIEIWVHSKQHQINNGTNNTKYMLSERKRMLRECVYLYSLKGT